MPSLRLTDDEARNLVAYLLSMKDERNLPRVTLDLGNPEKIARGDALIREFGCAGCHEIKGMEREGKVSVNLSDFGRKKVEQMDFGNTHPLSNTADFDYQENAEGAVSVKHTWAGWVYGKMKNSRQYITDRISQKMPLFSFNDEEIKMIRTFLMSMTRDVPLPTYQHDFSKRVKDLEAGRRLSVHYNCIQCHSLEDRGGFMTVKYEDPGLGPPPLPESQGAKVQEQWLHSFLSGPSTIRPWLKLRMPTFQFSDQEIGSIQKYFLGMSNQDLTIRDYKATLTEAKYVKPGKELFELYQCAKCHPSGAADLSELSASDLAPDLSLASSRLKPEWIVEWIIDPQKLQPGTRMPTFFYDGVAPDQETLGGDVREQAKALSTHIWNLGKRNR
jgi:mono/diheme cytochrome c family protein